jgi:hypothetical protein
LTLAVLESIHSCSCAPAVCSKVAQFTQAGSSYTSIVTRAPDRPNMTPLSRLTACGDGWFGPREACTAMPTPATTTSSTAASAPASTTRRRPAASRAEASSACRRRASAVLRGPTRTSGVPAVADRRIASSSANRVAGQHASATASTSRTATTAMSRG